MYISVEVMLRLEAVPVIETIANFDHRLSRGSVIVRREILHSVPRRHACAYRQKSHMCADVVM